VPIHLWEADTKRVVSSLIDFHLKSIVALAFTPDGAFLVSAGGDDDNSIAVHDWTTN
jgi:WD40 repeat protein